MRFVILVAIIGLVIGGIMPGKAQGKGKDTAELTAAQLTASPSIVPVGGKVTAIGAGFEPGSVVVVNAGHASLEITIDETGGFSAELPYVYNSPNAEGGYNEIRAYVYPDTLTPVASASFTVQ